MNETQVHREIGIVNKPLCFNVFIQKQHYSVSNCGKMLFVPVSLLLLTQVDTVP